MAAGAGLGALATLEVERLHLLQVVLGIAKHGAGQFIEIARVGGLFFWQHTALARADAGAGQFRASCQRYLRFFGKSTEAHVRNHQGNIQR